MKNRVILAGVGLLTVVGLSTARVDRLDAADSRCLPAPGSQDTTLLLKPPTGLRIVREQSTASPGRPITGGSRTHTYFDSLISRADCVAAYGMRSQTELDSIESLNKNSPKKRPIQYDPVQDAAELTFHAPSSVDVQGKLMPFEAAGTMLLTWEFRFDENFRWRGPGYQPRHKTWRLEPGPWLLVRTDYRHAANQGEFAEFFVTVERKIYLGPGSYHGGWLNGEMLQPQRATFYFQPDTWVRAWIYVEGFGQPIWYMSVWAADKDRDPVQLYDRIAMLPNEMGELNRFRIMYDTSSEQATYPDDLMHSWNRNIVVLQGLPPSQVPALLQRPVD